MTAWRQYAACRGMDATPFYSEDESINAQARAICELCPVREDCLAEAMETREAEGMWGGLTATERVRLRRRRQREERKEAVA